MNTTLQVANLKVIEMELGCLRCSRKWFVSQKTPSNQDLQSLGVSGEENPPVLEVFRKHRRHKTCPGLLYVIYSRVTSTSGPFAVGLYKVNAVFGLAKDRVIALSQTC